MQQVKVSLNPDEMKIMLECIFALNFQGKDVIKIGLLANKLMIELQKLEGENKK